MTKVKKKKKNKRERTRDISLNLPSKVSVGGALFAVSSVMVVITAHDGDTALLMLFRDIKAGLQLTVPGSALCRCVDLQQRCIYMIS